MGRTKNFSEEIEQKAISNYVVKKMGLQSAGREFGISQFMMEKILKEYGIPKRTYTEAKQDGRKYPCNDDFFKVQSANMAYVLGFIAADGYISKKENCISIELNEKDIQILEDIKAVTGVTRPITIQTRKNGNRTATLRNWSKSWKDDLAHYGITNKKTLILSPPELLLPQYRIDYIRGYFDGDGCISLYHSVNGKGYPFTGTTFEIVGASKKAISWMRLELIQHYQVILNKMSVDKTKNDIKMFKVATRSKDEIRKIYNLFYRDPSSLYLQRKKEKFETFLHIPRDSNSSMEE